LNLPNNITPFVKQVFLILALLGSLTLHAQSSVLLVVTTDEHKFYFDEEKNEITSFKSTIGILVILRKFGWLFSNGVIEYDIQIQQE